MKRNIVKNILKTCAAVFLAASLAGCSNLIVSDDDSDNSKIADVLPSSESSKKSVGAGTVAVTIGVPDYSKIAAENVSRSARAVAPQTTYARLGYSTDGEKFVYSDAVALSSDNATKDESGIFTQYTLTFSGIPAGTYAAGRLQIQLLKSASSTEAVTQGTNAQTVTVSSSADADATFYTVPTTLAKETGSLSKGEMVFLSKSVAANSVSTLTLKVGENDSYPLVALFNPDGSFKSATELSSSSNTLEINRYGEAESAFYYIGLYSKDADISVYTATWADEVYFTKFDPEDLYTLYGNGSITKDVSAADGSWSVTGGTDSAYAGVWTDTYHEHKTYDYDEEKGTGYDYTNERLFNFNNTTTVALKLKIGAGKTKVLRIDGGTTKSLNDWNFGSKAIFNIKDSDETSKTWEPYVGNSTYYVKVTGDSDGYVTITTLAGDNGRVYGITLADEVVDLSASGTRAETISDYNLSVYFGKGSSEVYSVDSKDSTDGVTLAPVVHPYHWTQTNRASYDGTTVTAGDANNGDGVYKELEDVSITYVWTKAGDVIADATEKKYTTKVSATYTMTASYIDSNGELHSDSAACKVYNSGAESVTITFDKNNEEASITTATQTVESGANVSLEKAKSTLGLSTATTSKVFKGWATSATATEAEYADGANISVTADTTLYAVWNEYVTVTFNPNYHNDTTNYSATIATATQRAEKGSATALTKASELGLVNNEKVFTGWAEDADATKYDFKDGEEVIFKEDTTLYAIWRDNFTEFSAKKLREKYLEKHTDLSVGTTNDVPISDENGFKYYNNNIIVSKSTQVKYQTGKTYDYDKSAGSGYSYKYRFNLNSKDHNDERVIKLRVGAGQTKILRIDGGANCNLNGWTENNPAITFTITDKNGKKTWSPYVRYSTYYVEVTGIDDTSSDDYGYITIKSNDHNYGNNNAVNGEIYGIYVVDSIVDTSSVRQTYKNVSYNSPAVTLDSTADLAGNESVPLKASVETPTRKTTTKSTSVDGTEKPVITTSDEELSNVTWSYQWYKSGEEIEGATAATYNATSSATYSVKVSYSYKDEDGNTKSKSTTAECVVSDSKASKVVVEFDKNSRAASISTDEQEIERGATVALAKAGDLGLVNDGYAFMGWATSAKGKVSYTDGAEVSFYSNTTLYAVWVSKSSGTIFGYKGTGSSLNYSGWKTSMVSDTDSRLNPANVTDNDSNTILSFVRWETSVSSRNRTGTDIDGNTTAYTYSMSCSETKDGSNPRYTQITVPKGKTADVFCAFSGSNRQTRKAGLGTQIGQSYDVSEITTTSNSVLSYITTEVALPAGTYYINVDSGIDFYALQVRLYSEN